MYFLRLSGVFCGRFSLGFPGNLHSCLQFCVRFNGRWQFCFMLPPFLAHIRQQVFHAESYAGAGAAIRTATALVRWGGHRPVIPCPAERRHPRHHIFIRGAGKPRHALSLLFRAGVYTAVVRIVVIKRSVHVRLPVFRVCLLLHFSILIDFRPIPIQQVIQIFCVIQVMPWLIDF